MTASLGGPAYDPTPILATLGVAKVKEAVGLRRQVVLTLSEGTVKTLEGAGNRIKYGFEHVALWMQSHARSKAGGIVLDIDVQEPVLEELFEEGRPEGMSDVGEQILEESDLAKEKGSWRRRNRERLSAMLRYRD